MAIKSRDWKTLSPEELFATKYRKELRRFSIIGYFCVDQAALGHTLP